MTNLEKEIEALKNIAAFGSLTGGKEPWYEEDFWFEDKLALVPLGSDYNVAYDFPGNIKYNAYVLPTGLSESDAIKSPELKSIRCYQWLKVVLNGDATAKVIKEKNLDIVQCRISFIRSFRMTRVKLIENIW